MRTTSPTQVPPMDPATEAGTALSGVAAAGAAATRRRWTKLGDNPLQTVLGAAVVGLLVFALTGNRSRIDRLEDTVVAGFARVDDRLTAQDAKTDAKFTALDDRLAAQDAKTDAKFTALDDRIAAQDAKTDAKFAALDDRLAAQDAKFAVLDDKIDVIDLKLTALIAALNATAEVGAALDGRLLDRYR